MPCACARTAVGRVGVEREPELDDEAHRTQRAQRVVGERGVGDHPHEPGLQVGAPPVRVEQLTAHQRLGHRVDREVAGGEVGGDVAVAHGHEVDVPGLTRSHDPPRAERAGELERRSPGRPGDLPRRLARIARESHVDVVGRPPEQTVAHSPADQPRLASGQRRPGRLERLRAHVYSRGTREEIPQVTS